MESARNLTGQSGWVNGSSFPTRTVGADRIRPQHKAPFRGGLCRVDILVAPYKWREQTVFRAGEGTNVSVQSPSCL